MEGMEVPVIAAQVTGSPSQPAAAAIQIIPTDLAFLFLPRTLVHLFFLEELLTEEDILLAAQLEDREKESIDRFTVQDERYRLMYAGEVIGFNYMKSTNNRSFVLQCLDLSSYWDACMQWYADWSVGGNALTDQEHTFVGAGQGLFDNITGGHKWVIGRILNQPPANPDYKDAKGLLGGLIHLLETIGGVRPRAKTFAGKRGVNDFFTIAELRYNLSGQIGAVEKDTTSARIYDEGAFRSWLQNGMQSLGNLISFRDIMRHVGQYVFHDVYPNPAARFVPGKITQTSKLSFSFTTTETKDVIPPAAQPLISNAKTFIDSAKSAYEAAGNAVADPGSGLTTVAVADGVDNLDKAGDALRQAIDEFAKPGVNSKAVAISLNLQAALSNLGLMPRSIFSTDGERVRPATAKKKAQLLDLALSELAGVKATEDEIKAHTVVSEEVEKKQGDFLFTQLVLPEAYFAAPPKCNVIFPDQYQQLTYSRNFLREITRLSLHAGNGIFGNDKILSHHYVAPNIADVKKQLVRNTFQFSAKVIFPHEVHSGIIPKFEWVSDGHRWGLRAALAKGKEPQPDKKISYIQRLANFHFFLNRWAARSMTINMRFNPRIVLGLPAVVLDRSSPSQAVLEAVTTILGSDRGVLPTAFIGKIAGFEHNVNQQTGSTQLALSQCRTHRGQDDEFLGTLVRQRSNAEDRQLVVDVTDMLQSIQDGITIDDRKFLIINRFLRNTLKNSLIRGLGKVTDVATTGSLSLTGDQATDLQVGHDLIVKGAQERHAGEFEALGPANQELFFLQNEVIGIPASITVTLQATLNEGKFAATAPDLSPEKLLIPGWFSDAWHPENISDSVYQPLLGCDAITGDPEIATDDAFLRLLRTLFNINDETNVLETDDQAAAAQIDKRDGFVSVNADGTLSSFQFGSGGIEKSIDGLVLLYGIVKRRGLDVQRFISEFTKRPIASLTDVLGTSDLEFDDDGNVIAGHEGFHSRAFGDYNTDVKHVAPDSEGTAKPVAGKKALANLIPTDQRASYNQPTFDDKKLGAVPTYLDPRGRARQRVAAYLEELRVSRGLLGT
jgi:hypothetical protein